ncbi:phosphotransferase [Bacillus solitudinis]|uniref:phosphotransferase n=1 Tax=Bacillus solitudinis TaxID=2014074 RepID=UPI000C234B38|nr:phosphotransferase [Bacillus solitudinis]
MDLQFLFQESIKEIHELNPGYENHASDVWLVKTDRQEVVVRSSRMVEEPNNDFWWGCKKLFGIDPRQVYELENVNNILNNITSIPVPKIINKGKASSRQFVVVEKLNGEVVQSFIGQPSTVLQSLGEGLARIHQYKENYVGTPSGNFKVKLEEFNQHLKDTMTELVSRFYYNQEQIKSKLAEIHNLINELPSPEYSSFVLVDMDPTQFLSNEKVITGLVDTEAYVIAPRELDFIGLEYVLDEKSAKEFKSGYEKVMEIPDLTKCREPYRYLYRLLSVQGKVDLNVWLNHKILF